MPDTYPLPPWLTPQAAMGWGQLAGESASRMQQATLARERMSQEAAMAAMEAQSRQQELAARSQAQQEQLQKENLMEQQKIAIDQAYKQTVTGLRQQDLDLAQKEFDAKTADASKRFAATQQFQKAMLPVEQGGEGLDPQKAALKYIAPYMTGTEVGRLATTPGEFQMKPPVDIPGVPGKQAVETSRGHFQIIDVPKSITNAPEAVSITDESGNIIGHYMPKIPGYTYAGKRSSTGLEEAINKYNEQKDGKKPPLGGDKMGTILPLPKKKTDLKEGKWYQTSRGPAEWDGEQFNPITQQMKSGSSSE